MPLFRRWGTILANGLFDARCEIEKCHFQTKMDIRSTECPLIDLSKSKWIPCSERLPKDDQTVLITHRGGVSVGWYNGIYWERGASTNHRGIKTVVAWMPLPEPYTEEES